MLRYTKNTKRDACSDSAGALRNPFGLDDDKGTEALCLLSNERENLAMKRKGWLLLAIGDSIDPIQLQKTLFKFAMESEVPDTEKYDFEPYNWGPCAKQIYPDIGDLRTKGLVEALPTGQG